MAKTLKIVVMDRDGVINEESDEFIKSPDEWIPIEGSLEAIARLNQAKVKVFIASNQSGIGRKFLDYETLNEIHRKMLVELAQFGGHVSGIFICPNLKGQCRKPNPGMLADIERRSGLTLKKSPLIGDSLRDIEAAMAFGLEPILVRTGNGSVTSHSKLLPKKMLVFENLSAAVDFLLERSAA